MQSEDEGLQKPIHGSPPYSELAKNIISDRKCTDLFCIIFYSVGMIAFITVLIYGFKEGHPLRLHQPYDTLGQACGQNGAKLTPYIYLVTPLVGHLNRSICVEACPYWEQDQPQPTRLQCDQNEIQCSQFFSMDGRTPLHNISSNYLITHNYTKDQSSDMLFSHSTFIYNSTDIYGMLCIPTGEQYVEKIYPYMNNIATLPIFNSWVVDIGLLYPVIIISAIITFVLGICFIILIKKYGGNFFIVLSFSFIFCLLIAFMPLFADRASYFLDKSDRNSQNGIQSLDDNDLQTAYALDGFIIFMGVMLLVYMIGIFCYMKEIEIGWNIMEASKNFVNDNPRIILVSVLFSLLTVGFWAIWMVSFVFIYSMGEKNSKSETPFDTIKWDANIRYYLIYHLLFGLWTNEILQTFSSFIISSTCCIWFYKRSNNQGAICESMRLSVRFHSGSLIYGAFLLQVAQIAQFWLGYINSSMRHPKKQNNCFMKCCCSCFLSCSMCFDRFLSFITKNAFIQIALTGDNFIKEGKNEYYLLQKKGGEYKKTADVGRVFTGVCKQFLTLLTSFIFYIVISYSPVISYIIGDLQFSIYGVALDTILQCSIIERDFFQNDPESIKERKTPEIVTLYLDKRSQKRIKQPETMIE